MKNKPIHVVLPQSFLDENHVSVQDVADVMSVVYNEKLVSFQVDVLPDDYL